MLRRSQSADVMQARRSRAMSMRRIIIKQGYLKKLPNSAKVGASFKKPERRWFVFGVMNNTQPYLEYFENEDGIFSDNPINIVPLDKCRHVTRNQFSVRYTNMFTLVLPDRELSLVAQSRSVMFEWLHCIKDKLKALSILNEGDGENDYVTNIASLPHQLQGRLRNSSSNSSNINTSTDNMSDDLEEARSENPTNAVEQEAVVYEEMWGPDGIPLYRAPELPAANDRNVNNLSLSNGNGAGSSSPSNTAAEYGNIGIATSPSTPPAVSTEVNPIPRPPSIHRSMSTPTHLALPAYSANSQNEPPPSWENSFLDQAPPETMAAPQSPLSPAQAMASPELPSSSMASRSDMMDDMTLFSSKMREAYGLQEGGGEAVGGWNLPPPCSADAPPPYIGKKVLERNANKSLKLTQVEQLEKEISNTGGVQIVLKKLDVYHAVALVDCCYGIWIAGWNQSARPFLHNALHIGDRLISVNGQVVESAKMARKLIKHCTDKDKITLILRRTPHARVFAIKRDPGGESLGITRRGGTAEIVEVKMDGIAGRHGVPARATTIEGDNLCNWWITEINNRPLNLFFKDDEIEKRLNAVGTDISIMIQPIDFILELAKRLKSMKNYKDFIVQ